MDKQLILARHSYAEKSYSGSDKQRKLRIKGVELAEKHKTHIAKWPVDFALVSGAKRTVETFEIFNKSLNLSMNQVYINQELYLTDLNTVLDAIQVLDESVKCLLVVGHNPTISVAGSFLDSNERAYSLRPGEALVFKLDCSWLDVGQGSGSIEQHIKIQD